MTEQLREDLVISSFLRSIGPWGNHVVIGGGYAPIIYKLYLAGKNNGNPPAGTSDIDSLIDKRVPKISEKSIAKHLDEAGFAQMFKDRDNPATESYVKEINGVEVEIEFLTDNNTRGDKNKNIKIHGTGITAQQLTYLELSINSTTKFKTFSGERGLVVTPEAWIFHKGLTFTKRKDKNKKFKDLYGIWYVATQLSEFSDEAIKKLKSLFRQDPKWHMTFCKNLQGWLDQVVPIEWISLENQDPYGNLKKEPFVEMIRMLLTIE
jgi:hypothetical protein